MQRISLEDYFLIVEGALGRPARENVRQPTIDRAQIALDAPFGTVEGVELYPELHDKVAALVTRLVRGRPLDDGNKRVAGACAIELVERNRASWRAASDGGGLRTMIDRVATGRLSEQELASWLREQIVLDAEEAAID